MQKFIEFYFLGVSIEGRNERKYSEGDAIDAPDYAISYRIFEKDSCGNKINFSSYHFLGTEYTAEEFKKKFPQLASSEDLKNANRVVKTILGNFYPLAENDVVIPA